MRIRYWSSDVCSADLLHGAAPVGIDDDVAVEAVVNAKVAEQAFVIDDTDPAETVHHRGRAQQQQAGQDMRGGVEELVGQHGHRRAKKGTTPLLKDAPA